MDIPSTAKTKGPPIIIGKILSGPSIQSIFIKGVNPPSWSNDNHNIIVPIKEKKDQNKAILLREPGPRLWRAPPGVLPLIDPLMDPATNKWKTPTKGGRNNSVESTQFILLISSLGGATLRYASQPAALRKYLSYHFFELFRVKSLRLQ